MIQDIVLYSVVLNVNIHPEFGNILPEDKCWNKRKKIEKENGKSIKCEQNHKKNVLCFAKDYKSPTNLVIYTNTSLFPNKNNNKNKTFKMLFHPLFYLFLYLFFFKYYFTCIFLALLCAHKQTTLRYLIFIFHDLMQKR